MEHHRFCFSGLILASLGCCCVAAFLAKRASASAHVRAATGYAIINWLQSLLAALSVDNQGVRYGLLGAAFRFFSSPNPTIVACRSCLYTVASLWMQSLIASRVELLEKTSGQKYCGACIRRLVRVQICFAFLTGLSCASILLVSGDLPFLLQPYHLALASFTVLFNILTTMMVALSLTQFFRHLRKVLQLAELSDMSVPARSSLRRARRFAALQFTGVLLSLVLTICVVPCIWKSMLLNSTLKLKFSGLLDLIPLDASVVVQACDLLGNALGVLLLSGSHRLPKADGGFGHRPVGHAANSPKAMPAKETDWNPAWKGKVEELSLRGMTLRSLLRFYQDDLPSIRDWQYAPKQHKTRDVARRAIIPLTSNEEAAYAVSVFNRDGGQRAQVMVTHNWANCFKDLLAAVLSDALQECSFSLATRLLEGESDLLCEMLTHSGRLDDTYWICAFAVNQHICICHSTLTTGTRSQMSCIRFVIATA